MKDTHNENLLLVNMPDCSNLLFVFNNNEITKSKRISYINAKNAILFYKLPTDIQNKIENFLNPNAI